MPNTEIVTIKLFQMILNGMANDGLLVATPMMTAFIQ